MIKYLISILIGFILGYILTILLLCTKKKGPNSNEIKKHIFKYNDKYYKFTTEICFCPIS
jgi:ABC-type methionine transport system permease subunit